ncbi:MULTISPECIES: alpha/beta hydrolase [Corynebacterium]|uniref:Trehalose corynomycolyl transferase B n=1 Tax=Corynebacterium ramonii TaxID=3026968 RepID=A0ABN4EXD9_9CORY|nr:MULTISPECIES: alpha/beta hydrolase family protein [Corynebacterium]AIU33610.1 Trehalose corynomycolyl transferase B [Corynebacterium ramonii FRC0011]ESU57393.1 esterase [Corynebacterium ulcerans NCTC 12077]STC81262.1 trehalose corynomycolyl transferase B [Corynebacterium ulcerans]
MTIASRLKKVGKKATATLTAVATAAALTVVGTGVASAGPRDWLRPDATGHCEWDAANYWVQRCDVASPAMGHNVTVQIQPAGRGGNAALYLLDGARASDAANAWTFDASAQTMFVDNNITLAMPVGGAGSFYTDWAAPSGIGSVGQVFKWETFLTQELPAYLEAHFGVARNNNSIGGLSMGATAAMNLAALHPEQFRQVLSYSGYLAMTAPGMYSLLGLALLEVGGLSINSMYGSFFSPRRVQLDPLFNMRGLDGKDVYVSAASGAWGGPDIENYSFKDRVNGSILEVASRLSTKIWEAKAKGFGLNYTADYPAVGIHNWLQWNYQLAITKERILNVMNAW